MKRPFVPLIVVLLLAMAACGGDDDDGAVFLWGDDLHEWVTDEEMADAIAGLVPGYSGEDLQGGAVGHGPGDGWNWAFRVPGEETAWEVHAHPHDDLLSASTDPRLPPGVTYGPDWGGYMLKGSRSDEVIGIIVRQPDGSSLSERDRVFAVASTMLPEMGWVD